MRSRVLYVIFVVVSFLPSVWLVHGQRREDRVVRSFLVAHGLQGAPRTKNTALAVSDALRSQFEVREDRWKKLSFRKRPFLRHDTAFLLDAKEGMCGEGTRVLVAILQELGFDATRISLYDRFLRSEHTLASVLIEGREVFVDSINSTEPVNAFLRSEDLSSADFQVTRYDGDIVSRIQAGAALARQQRSEDPRYRAFFEKFRLYSYEAVPASKLVSAVGLDWRVFNLHRPAPVVSWLAERPRAIQAVAAGLAAIGVHLLVGAALLLRRLRRGARR